MKITSLVTVALATVAQLASAAPRPVPGSFDFNDIPITPRDIEDGPTIRGAGALHEEWLQKRNVDTLRVTGVRKGYTGAYRVYRQEIRNFMVDQNGLVGTLFLLALNKMYTRSRGDWNSFWELAGIHGRPYQAWGGDTPSSAQYAGRGYCTHGSTLFPTWHRPYLAYVEEVIWANAQLIVSNEVKVNKAAWEKALSVIRLPYYDWALNKDGYVLPQIFIDQQYKANLMPDGRRNIWISNPLFSSKLNRGTYDNQQLFPTQPWNFWPQTKRSPSSRNDPGATSNNKAVSDSLAANGPSLRQRVYALLMRNNRWASFSNRQGAASVGENDSLESIHDTIHGLVGGGGHMSYVEYSSFDPIFFLHHCNVDRLFAIWQAIWPTTYVSSQRNGGGTYGVAPNTLETRTSSLRPFRGLSGGYWTSDGVRDTSLFGYGYYETPKWKYSKSTEKQYSDTVKRTVANLYGPTVNRNSKIDVANTTEEGIDNSIINDGFYNEWRIDCQADKSALNGTYIVNFFLERPSRDPKEWSSQPGLVGSYVVFTHVMQAAPGIDAGQIDNNVTGTVPLTDAMIKAFPYTDLNSLKREEAAGWLIKNLRWRVTLDDGTPVKVKNVKGLSVSVSTSLCSVPGVFEFQEFGPWVKLTDIGRRIGRDGGPDKIGIVPVLSITTTPVSSILAASSTADPEVSTTETAAKEELTTTSEAATPTGSVDVESTPTESVTSEAPTATD